MFYVVGMVLFHPRFQTKSFQLVGVCSVCIVLWGKTNVAVLSPDTWLVDILGNRKHRKAALPAIDPVCRSIGDRLDFEYLHTRHHAIIRHEWDFL